MYRLLIDNKQWKDCSDVNEKDVFYVAKTLSKYLRCRVDVYKTESRSCIIVASFESGKLKALGVVA